MSSKIRFTIEGKPQQQGSKSAYLQAGRIKLVEANKNLMPWRTAAIPVAQQAAIAQDWEFPEPQQPVMAKMLFVFDKPKSVRRDQMSVKPDLDHLIRAVGDLLTQAGLIVDDSQIVEIAARKEYGEIPRTEITLFF